MRTVTTDDKCVSRFQFVAILARDMYSGTADDDHNFSKLVTVQSKRLLRIASLHYDWESVGMKPVLFFQHFHRLRNSRKLGNILNSRGFVRNRNGDSNGAIVLVNGQIVKVFASLTPTMFAL